jgi:transcriptional regulator with XRE-family HTH domain
VICHPVKVIVSQPDSVILQCLSRSGRVCDITFMPKEVIDINAIRTALRREMERRGIKAKRLAKAAGLGETAVRDILEKVDDPRVGTLIKIADALDIPASSLFGSQVPVLGKIGAGGSILFEEADEPELVIARQELAASSWRSA